MTLQISDLDQYKASGVGAGYPDDMRTFYSPWDDVHGALQAVISSTTTSLVLAMYGYDDDALAALIDGFLLNGKIYCQISLDKSQAGGVHERAILEKYKHEMDGNSVAVGTSEKSAIMHRKMAIIDGVWRLSGSTNWSTSGERLQDNELTIMRNASVCAEARPILDIEHDKMLKALGRAR